MTNSAERGGFLYVVECAFSEQAVAAQWAAWLRERHLQDVIDAGARTALLVTRDGPHPGDAACVLEAHYTFTDRAAFEAYERDHATRLRGEGLALFPLSRGLTYTRRTGLIHASPDPRSP